ncbi:amidohydrolase family protein [Streptomyces sp. NBC_01016]|uniref:amidohydrolase family protein n=1 Tax=Streptomyces sp. NBC_01016 TaxID=2903720 RepID=UPI00224C9D02|nr:amidohydrolase family protein [Streptomyces sp. NBC_01016]MCX4835763.1 amidohydrolase family protein [Streptomyces sp. NBC_01016]
MSDPRPSLIDAHHHLWQLGVRDQPWIKGPQLAPLRRDFTLDDLRRQTMPARVDGTVVVQTVPDPAETRELLALAVSDALVRGVVGWIDLTRPDVSDALAGLREEPGGGRLVGVRHAVQAEPDPEWLLRADVRRGLGALADAGLGYDVLARPAQLPACTRAAARHPDLTFVLDHAGNPPDEADGRGEWERAVRAFAALPNTACKLSGAALACADAPAKSLDAFGPTRVMFGSDWPVSTLTASYAEVTGRVEEVTKGLAAGEREAVLRGTARRVYRF